MITSRLFHLILTIRWTAIAFLLLTALLFQNCTEPLGGADGFATNKLQGGNGAGYDGKLTGYARLVPGDVCDNQKVSVGTLSLQATTATITTNEDSCQNISREVPLSELEFSSFSKKYIGYDGGVFTYLEDINESIAKRVFTEAWCRGQSADKSGRSIEVAVEWQESGRSARMALFTSALADAPLITAERDLDIDRVAYRTSQGKLTVYFDRKIPGRQKVMGLYSGNIEGTKQDVQLECLLGGQFDIIAPRFAYVGSTDRTLATGERLTDFVPTVNKAEVSYAISEPLPPGINFNPLTGEVSGAAGAPAARKKYLVTAKFQFGEIARRISLGIGEVQVVDQATVRSSASPCVDLKANCDLAGAVALANQQAPIPLIVKLVVPQISLSGSELRIEGDLLVSGLPSKTTLDAGKLSRHFNVAGYLSLQNLTLVNGKEVYGGSIEVVHGGLTVRDSVFSMNYAGDDWNSGQGGAIHATESSVEILNSEFIGNQTRQGGANVFGGAIYIQGGEKAVIKNSLFRANYADFGGAIAFIGMSHPVDIEDCDFVSNSAGEGGAFIIRDSAEFLVSKSRFVNNHSVFEGGAIWAKWTARAWIKDSTFEGNKTETFSSAALFWWGVYSPYSFGGSSTLYVLDSQFTNHSASSFGRAVLIDHLGEVNLKGTSFRNNGTLKNCQAIFEAPFSEILSLGGNFSSDNSCPQ